MGFNFKSLFGDQNKKSLKKYENIVPLVNGFEESISALSDDDLRGKTDEFKTRLRAGETLEDILPEAFAVVREASKRTLNQRHYDVQLIGGMIMNDGNIAEMRTGEGKTLVATLPVYLNALSEKGVHLVTVNDYLARRDAVWMGEIYAFLGMSVGIVNSQESFLYNPEISREGEEKDQERDEKGYFKVVHEFLQPCTRTEAYAADITYGTNSEFGFDYLRDNISHNQKDLRQRDLHFAIIDEIDSILIDEARTPLIISAPTSESENLYQTFASIAKKLVEGEDYEVDEKLRAATLTDSGIEKAEKILGIENIYTEGGVKYVHHLETAVRAKSLFKKEKEYVVRDGKVVIVDEFTGRILAGRRYSEGLHQAIEAKEGVKLEKESKTFASITYQNYFRMYEKLSGMTGTAITSQEEFYKVYGLETIVVPTNKPIVRLDRDDLIFQTEAGKFKAISQKIKELNEAGQPVLIGTPSIEKNELLSQFLAREGVKHSVLNAKNHENEGAVTAGAGKMGAVTIATNMAGRGVDIKLGGDEASEEEKEKIKEMGGLFVVATDRHEARRIDNQLRGRAGRQGDPGETQFFVSLDDDLMRIFASDTVKGMMSKLGMPEDQPIKNSMITKALESAQEKIEGLNFDRRKHVLQFDDVMNHQRKIIYTKRRSILTATHEELAQILREMSDSEHDKVIEEKIKAFGEEAFYEAFRSISLQTIDLFWVDHLEAMDYLKSSVNLRAVGQRDPLVEYKREGLMLFKSLEADVDEQILKLVSNMGEGSFKEEARRLERISREAKVAENSNQGEETAVRTVVNNSLKVGRNDKVELVKGEESMIIKYKKAEDLIENDGWKLKRVIQE